MEKVYVKRIANKKAKEIFKGEKAVKIRYGTKIMNMVGTICSKKLEEVIFCSYLTQKPMCYGAVVSEEFIVDETTKGSFIVVK